MDDRDVQVDESSFYEEEAPMGFGENFSGGSYGLKRRRELERDVRIREIDSELTALVERFVKENGLLTEAPHIKVGDLYYYVELKSMHLYSDDISEDEYDSLILDRCLELVRDRDASEEILEELGR